MKCNALITINHNLMNSIIGSHNYYLFDNAILLIGEEYINETVSAKKEQLFEFKNKS